MKTKAQIIRSALVLKILKKKSHYFFTPTEKLKRKLFVPL